MPHEEIRRVLDECRNTREFVAYHKWGDQPDVFLVGVVRDLSGTKATFTDVDPRGRLEEGTHAVPLRLIHSLDRGTLYLRRLQILHGMESEEETETEDVRNPLAHNAKVDWALRELDALDMLTTVSMTHRKLDGAWKP